MSAIETLFNSRIKIRQNKTGYRFSIDSVLLASYVNPNQGETILDFGTGCGIIPLIIGYRHAGVKIFGIEIQKELAEIAISNIKENKIEDRISILNQDIKSLKKNSIFSKVNAIVTNPPYRKTDSGRINPGLCKAIAKHEILIKLPQLIKAASKLLQNSGKFYIIYPSERLTDLLCNMRYHNIEPKTVTMVYSYKNHESKRVIVSGTKEGGAGLKVLPPLIIYNRDGSYSERVKKMFIV